MKGASHLKIFRRITAAVCLSAVLFMFAAPAFAEELIIWYDDQGYPHASKSMDEIPKQYQPYVKKRERGILLELSDLDKTEALKSGWELGLDSAAYGKGLGVFQPFNYNLDMEQKNAYVMIGTKYALLKAASASAASRGATVPTDFINKVENLDSLPISFYSWGFNAVLILLIQDGKYIKGEEGFPKDVDPKLRVPAFTMSFPYDAIDFTLPVDIQIFNREGKVIKLKLDLPQYK